MSGARSTQPILLIDGYNVIAPVAAPGRRGPDQWLDAERRRLLDRLADALESAARQRTWVVFDARNPPPGVANEMIHRDIQVRFAVNHAEADDLIEEIIAGHHAPKSLTVVSSDHRLQAAARRRRAICHDSETWMDALLDGKVHIAPKFQTGPSTSADWMDHERKPDADMLDADEVQSWLDEFGDDL